MSASDHAPASDRSRRLTDQLLERLPPAIARALEPLTREGTLNAEEARRLVEGYLARLEALSAEREFVDVSLARNVARRCIELVDRFGGEPDGERRRLVQAAVRYFVLEDDVEEDTTSLVGFDDDFIVIQMVEELLARD